MPTKLIIDCDTNTEVEFELTPEEVEAMEASITEYKLTQVEQPQEEI